MNILLAIDGSSYSDAAVEALCQRPWPPHSEVRVMTVLTPWTEEFHSRKVSSMFDSFNQELRVEAMRCLNSAEVELRDKAPELRVTTLLRDGWPKYEILSEAAGWGADLIMLGSQGRGAVERLFLGSVSLAVATNARCSVEIVRARVADSKKKADVEK